MSCRAEFTIEPFEEGFPGRHVMAAVEAVRALGFEPELGPFGTSVEGDPARVIDAINAMLATVGTSGASRVTLHIDLDYQP